MFGRKRIRELESQLKDSNYTAERWKDAHALINAVLRDKEVEIERIRDEARKNERLMKAAQPRALFRVHREGDAHDYHAHDATAYNGELQIFVYTATGTETIANIRGWLSWEKVQKDG